MWGPRSREVYDAKRMIGRKFSDAALQKDLQHWPFKVVRGPDDKPLIEVLENGKPKRLHPEEVSSMVLAYLKAAAEA